MKKSLIKKIIFNEKIIKVNEIINDSKKALVTFKDGSRKLLNIWKISPTREEFFNYVLGVEEVNNQRIVFSYHIYDFKTIIELDEDRIINEDELEKLELMIYQSPEFAINKIEDIITK